MSFFYVGISVSIFIILTTSWKGFGSTAVCFLESAGALEILTDFVTSLRIRSAAFTQRNRHHRRGDDWVNGVLNSFGSNTLSRLTSARGLVQQYLSLCRSHCKWLCHEVFHIKSIVICCCSQDPTTGFYSKPDESNPTVAFLFSWGPLNAGTICELWRQSLQYFKEGILLWQL